ncbi:GIY-YIG nuclease family protein [Streptomyces sp. NPDC007025]|uniref:GIY-YIG nuclease family protein n=1 Tax=Streptomyces sp. NPDC007025 TaxID=3364771 RepID=UPI0036BE5DA9
MSIDDPIASEMTDYVVLGPFEIEDDPNTWYAVQPKEDTSWRKAAKQEAAARGDDVRTAVYRLRDSDDQLLYVGISTKPPQRWVQHAQSKKWWPEVATLCLEWCDSQAEARAVEAHAIRVERPQHNIVHNSKPRSRAEWICIRETRVSSRPAHWVEAE